jgi:hypothetical protein
VLALIVIPAVYTPWRAWQRHPGDISAGVPDGPATPPLDAGAPYRSSVSRRNSTVA